jgi:hypothetical protein
LLLGAIGLLALSACGNDSVQSPADSAPATAAAATSSPDTLSFTAPLVGGDTIDLSQYAGTPVLLWFWAPT